MAAPPSQKFRTIGLRLTGGGEPDSSFTFNIRPEELTRTEPSRLTVNQTLGGAWADSFDVGVSTITLAGHCGWRGGLLLSGEDTFQNLRTTVFQGWHARRKATIDQGGDPSDVELFFTDNLDTITSVVAPKSFALRRSKSSPLLMRYQIQLVELGDASASLGILDKIINALSNPLRWITGQLGLENVLAVVQNYVTVGTAVFGAVAGAVTQFVNTAAALIGGVANLATTLQGQFVGAAAGLLAVSTAFCAAGSNAFGVLGADDTLPNSLRLPLMALAANMNDAACTMSNSFNTGGLVADYSALYGASGCSSTGGGLPWSEYTAALENPLLYVLPTDTPLVTVTPAGAFAMASLGGDPIPLIGQTAAVQAMMIAAAQGVMVAT